MIITIGNDRVDTRALPMLGSGGEADVYALPNERALKLYKTEQHPDFASDAAAKLAARARLAIAEDKLSAFPLGVPAHVLGPLELARDRRDRVIGFVMARAIGAVPWYATGARQTGPSTMNRALGARRLVHLAATLRRLHQMAIVVGDLSDLNLLVCGEQVFVIDADSFQYAGFSAAAFNPRFCDPLALSGTGPQTRLTVSPASDWYAFSVLAMLTLTGVHPYGGVAHRVSSTGTRTRIGDERRLRERITVFDDCIIYPRSAPPLAVLPLALLAHLEAVFQHDLRDDFPIDVLARARWGECAHCGLEHAAVECPLCAPRVATHVSAPASRCQSPSASSLLVRSAARTHQPILWVGGSGDRLWIRAAGDPSVVGGRQCDLVPTLTLDGRSMSPVAASRHSALWADPQGPHLIAFAAAMGPRHECVRVDMHEGKPAAALAGDTPMWMSEGIVWRRGRVGNERITQLPSRRGVLVAGDSLWGAMVIVGSALLAVAGSTRRQTATDGIILDPATAAGEPVDMAGAAGDTLLWFAWRRRTAPDSLELAAVDAAGNLRARDRLPVDLSLLPLGGRGGLAGGFAHGLDLFVPTDEGIVRITARSGGDLGFVEIADTAGLITGDHRLAAGPGCLFAYSSHEVIELRRHVTPQPKGLRP